MIYYASRYGSSRKYAHMLGNRTGLKVQELKGQPVETDQPAVFILSVYAGQLYRGKEAARLASRLDEPCILGVCGLADPGLETTQKQIEQEAAKAGFDLNRTTCVPLYGAIDYQKLSWIHRLMMAGVYRVLKKKPQGNEVFISSYGSQASMIDERWLKPILKQLKPQD